MPELPTPRGAALRLDGGHQNAKRSYRSVFASTKKCQSRISRFIKRSASCLPWFRHLYSHAALPVSMAIANRSVALATVWLAAPVVWNYALAPTAARSGR
jgi:hypothetical protein